MCGSISQLQHGKLHTPAVGVWGVVGGERCGQLQRDCSIARLCCGTRCTCSCCCTTHRQQSTRNICEMSETPPSQQQQQGTFSSNCWLCSCSRRPFSPPPRLAPHILQTSAQTPDDTALLHECRGSCVPQHSHAEFQANAPLTLGFLLVILATAALRGVRSVPGGGGGLSGVLELRVFAFAGAKGLQVAVVHNAEALSYRRFCIRSSRSRLRKAWTERSSCKHGQ